MKMKNTYNLFDGTFCLLFVVYHPCTYTRAPFEKSTNFALMFQVNQKRCIRQVRYYGTHTHERTNHPGDILISKLPMHFLASFTKLNPFSKQIILLIIELCNTNALRGRANKDQPHILMIFMIESCFSDVSFLL